MLVPAEYSQQLTDKLLHSTLREACYAAFTCAIFDNGVDELFS